MYSDSNLESPRKYGEWFVVDEVDYVLTDSTLTSRMSSLESGNRDNAYTSNDTNGDVENEENQKLDKLVSDKINQINRETNGKLFPNNSNHVTSDDVKKIKEKLDKIQSRWDEEDIKKYTQNNNSHPELNKIDQLLGEAMKEVAEIQRGANMAVLELSKSVESVEELNSKTADLKDSTIKFRRNAYEEKASQPLAFRTQVFLAAFSIIALKFLISIFS